MGVSYVHSKSIAIFLRALIKQSSSRRRTVIEPSKPTSTNQLERKQKQPSPVLINFCGSGFVLHTFGSDDEYCRFIADWTNYTVIDVQYRLAPENPFPAAFNDAEDVVTWVRSQPESFDIHSLSLSGFSAGANIALAVLSSSSPFCQKDGTNVFLTVMSFYGPVDMALPTPQKPQADPSNFIMRKIFPTLSHLCHKCLNFTSVDPNYHRLSPLFADAGNFPPNVLIMTAPQDPFAIEAERLADKIRSVEKKVVVCNRMDGCAHGWDKEAVRGTSQCKAKDDAYKLAASMLQRAENEVNGSRKTEV
ncbi:uncharacterized protein N7482_000910 [Penicillium canariense]|uniref:Alpha/beta hydrolase fold-3 domain-containing protein n=1 Tax=Penicillium canariense TaxID=189055 RepID=A0A9W9IE66_9EURO|nr:uncharacterized protein N7482_000910 [Penicillium canariense]KAJ5175033.1 hypothetical protein N7482_000910 [Penicillium canariense]